MQSLSAQQVLEVWEAASLANRLVRSGTLLELAQDQFARDEIPQLTVGERNRQLLLLRKRLFGSRMQAYHECADCGQSLDLDLEIDQLIAWPNSDAKKTKIADSKTANANYEISFSDISARVRLPTGRDLERLLKCVDPEHGAEQLLADCVSDLQRHSEAINVQDLTPPERDELETLMAELDPCADILFSLNCPACSQNTTLPLDITAFLWTEYDLWVRNLLEDIHLLASHYSWSENEILQMSSTRRNFYVQRLLA